MSTIVLGELYHLDDVGASNLDHLMQITQRILSGNKGNIKGFMTKIGWFNFRNKRTSCIGYPTSPGATERHHHG